SVPTVHNQGTFLIMNNDETYPFLDKMELLDIEFVIISLIAIIHNIQ
ncbi:hypothetical protein H9565_16690, partial [Zobellia russellii]|nr:hypothetical protein [Zobellia russellii]